MGLSRRQTLLFIPIRYQTGSKGITMARSAKEGSCRSAIALAVGRVLAGHLVAAGAARRLSDVTMVPEVVLGQPGRDGRTSQVTWPEAGPPKVSRASAAAGRPVRIAAIVRPAPSAITSSYAMPIVIGPMPLVLSR